jgi:pSer/pThr/pTyr-binding forkhead associated (FHA) protein
MSIEPRTTDDLSPPDEVINALSDLIDASQREHYYDLLGVELFCSHFERINQAVRKQYRLIKTYHDHPDRATRESLQDLMNNVAGARAVLTDPDRKEAYDRSLAERLGVDRESYLAARIAAPLPEFQVSVIAGPALVEQRFELIEGAEFTIGNDPRCTVALDSPRAADRHATIRFVDGDWIVTPTDRDAIVQVNGTVTKEFVLAENDQVDVAGFRLRFARTGASRAQGANVKLPPPLSLIVRKGACIPAAVINMLPPQRVLIGSAATALWQLPDRTVSRHHCAIQNLGDAWEAEDLDSTNGIRVNGVEVLRKILKDRDVLTIGQFEIVASLRF